MSEATRDLLLCASALLDQGQRVDRLSRPLTAAALIGILAGPAIVTQPPWLLVGFTILVALTGLIEAYLGIRVGFDAALFRQLGGALEAPDFAATDAALTRLGLLAAPKVGRPAEARIAGARRLFGFQILAFGAQMVSVLVGSGVAWTWR